MVEVGVWVAVLISDGVGVRELETSSWSLQPVIISVARNILISTTFESSRNRIGISEDLSPKITECNQSRICILNVSNPFVVLNSGH